MANHLIQLRTDGIIDITFVPEDDREKAQALVDATENLLASHPGTRHHLLVDLHAASSTAEPTILKMYAAVVARPEVDKLAIVGAIDETQRAFVLFTMKFARKDAVQFFLDRPKALDWLHATT